MSSAGEQSTCSPPPHCTHGLRVPPTGRAQGKEHFFLIKQKGFSSKHLPLLIFPGKLVANWRQLPKTFVEPVLDAPHTLFPPRSAGKANAHRPPRPPEAPR